MDRGPVELWTVDRPKTPVSACPRSAFRVRMDFGLAPFRQFQYQFPLMTHFYRYPRTGRGFCHFAQPVVPGKAVTETHALPDSPRVANCEPGIPGGRLFLALPRQSQDLQPRPRYRRRSDGVIRLLFSSLVQVNMETQQAEPGLAESWTVAPDQKIWTFKLRKNLHWSDGQPLTADDVLFTWNDVHVPTRTSTRSPTKMFHTGGKNFEITKVDDLTVRVVTPEIFAPFLEYFGSVAIIPKHVLATLVKTGGFLSAYNIADNPENIVGSGPFRLKEFKAEKGVLLERNPEYWTVDKQGRRLPYFDEVQLVITTTPANFQAAFLSGATAAYENVRPEDYGALP